MRHFLTTVTLILIISCKNENSEVDKSSENIIDQKNDSSMISPKTWIVPNGFLLHKHSQESYNYYNRFTDTNSFCRLHKDSLIFHFGELIWGASNMDIAIVGDSSSIAFSKSDCMTDILYKNLSSTIKFEKKIYSVGDSIELDVSYKGLGQYYEKVKTNKDDTVEVFGKIKLKITNRNFNRK